MTYLEPDQRVADAERPLARAQVSRRATVGLWALRIVVIALDAMVLYSFFSALAG